MSKDKYIAYISTYTQAGNDMGIRIYDVDVKAGRLTEKNKVKITNPSYVTISHNGKYLYSITDMGVESFKIQPDGELKLINKASINGMRGCHLSTDYNDQYLFVAGYHDGKITVLKLKKNGAIDHITDEVFHKGMGSISERNDRPHVSCVKMSRDNKFLCASDLGLDHVKIYRFDNKTGKITLAEVIRCDQNSAPRYIKFHKSGKYAYIIHELSNTIDVYTYDVVKDMPVFERIQRISTLNNYHAGVSAACAMDFTPDHKYLICSNAGDNSVGAFKINEKTGELTKDFVLPVSGDYPKDIAIFPDMKHIISINNESDTVTFFKLDLKNKLIIMNGPEMKVPQGNCAVMFRLPQEDESEK